MGRPLSVCFLFRTSGKNLTVKQARLIMGEKRVAHLWALLYSGMGGRCYDAAAATSHCLRGITFVDSTPPVGAPIY